MTIDDSSIPTDVLTGAEAEAAVAGFSAPEPAEQLHELDFLLGDFRCEYVNLSSEPPTAGTASWNTQPVAGGQYYEMAQWIPVPGIRARWLFGWNKVEEKFFSHYTDDWGNHGTTSCQGWEDGSLRCVGEYVAFGQPFVFQEELTPISPDHFRKRGFVKQGDDWVQVDLINCFRDPRAVATAS
ncbi:NlmOI [Streptomyces cavernae]|uniref:NlmOI n=1 Tax=Streptomyces cavernae TaxID=2259034 RepID=UPI000FEB6A9A|nr:NlmOI [Streptomyces cavernae]